MQNVKNENMKKRIEAFARRSLPMTFYDQQIQFSDVNHFHNMCSLSSELPLLKLSVSFVVVHHTLLITDILYVSIKEGACRACVSKIQN